MKWWVGGLIFLCACSPRSMEDYYHEGQALTKKLVDDLKCIESREDLEKAVPHLKKRFEALTGLMMEASLFQERHPEEYFEEEPYAFSLSDELLVEVKRIYELEQGKELMEKAEREALLRLDAFKRKRKE